MIFNMELHNDCNQTLLGVFQWNYSITHVDGGPLVLLQGPLRGHRPHFRKHWSNIYCVIPKTFQKHFKKRKMYSVLYTTGRYVYGTKRMGWSTKGKDTCLSVSRHFLHCEVFLCGTGVNSITWISHLLPNSDFSEISCCHGNICRWHFWGVGKEEQEDRSYSDKWGKVGLEHADKYCKM